MKKNLSYLQAFFLAVACLAVSGCSNQQQTGVVVGGAGGAAVGAAVGVAATKTGSSTVAGGVAGGAAGLIVGSIIGAAMTQDRPANKKTTKKENNCAECCEKRSLRTHNSCQTCHCENKR